MFRARSVASIIALRVTAGCIARLDGGHDGRTDGRLVEGMCKVGAEAFLPRIARCEGASDRQRRIDG